MSERPPPTPLTEAERDAILRRLDQTVALYSGQVQSHGAILEDHGKRIATLETQVLAGVHAAPAAPEIPVYFEEPRPDHLSPPPMRAPMSTHESIQALEENQGALAKQTEANKRGNLLLVAAFLGTFAGAAANGCQHPLPSLPFGQRQAPVPQPTGTTAPVLPSTPPAR